ncbi:branched-chain amino acid ABC transporter substrate-binding protein [Candidatus Poribacteria bacterium]|nr:branched-chain amino acid ABC transporter substrate-binding protein [Candidatus Poribacteria bacterium]
MKARRIVGIATVLMCALLASTSCGRKDTTSTIRIGVAAPLTGSGATYGALIRMGAELAQEEINAAGGIQGKQLELVFGDDQAREDQAVAVATKFSNDPSIVAVVGHFNSICSMAGKPIYQRAKVVEFSPGSTNVDVTKGSEWTFRNLYHDDYQGTFLASYAKRVLNLSRIAVFFDNDDYGSGLKNAFMKEAEAVGLEIVGTPEAYQREQTLDFSSAIDKFAALKPDAVFIAGLYNEAASIVKQTREKGVNVPFLAADGVSSQGYIDIAGEAAEGTYITTPFIVHPDIGGPAAQAFRVAFEAKFKQVPDTWAALTYDAVKQTVAAITKVGANRQAIRDEFAATTSAETAYQGVTGPTYFDENGDCLKPAYVTVVKDGEFVPAEKQAQ